MSDQREVEGKRAQGKQAQAEAAAQAQAEAAQAEATEGEAIGRPGPWGENRYEKKGQPLDQSVLTPPRTSPNEDKPISTPVTRRDYGTPGGDAGAGGDAG